MVDGVDKPAWVTRTLAAHDLFVAELAPVTADLESVFLELTGTAPVAGQHRAGRPSPRRWRRGCRHEPAARRVASPLQAALHPLVVGAGGGLLAASRPVTLFSSQKLTPEIIAEAEAQAAVEYEAHRSRDRAGHRAVREGPRRRADSAWAGRRTAPRSRPG